MSKLLSSDDIQRFQNEGYLFPIRVMSEAEAADVRKHLEEFEARTGGPLRGDLRHKAHLLFPWLANLVRNEKILDAVEDLYGQDLLCWTSNFFIKEAQNPAFVSWHQDSTYWGLSTPDVVTAWVALVDELNESSDGEQRIQRRNASDPGHSHSGPNSTSRYVRQA